MSAPVAATGTMNALTIHLADEIFAIEAESVSEILEHIPITTVPLASAFVSGLINVRGRVVPLADLRVAFDMPRAAADIDARIVVIEATIGGETVIVGILADKVDEVTEIDLATVEPAPRVGMRWRADYLKGVGKLRGNFILIPDLVRIFDTQGGMNVPQAQERLSNVQ